MSDRHHPLDPLDAGEITRAVALAPRPRPGSSDRVRGDLRRGARARQGRLPRVERRRREACRARRSSCCSTASRPRASRPIVDARRRSPGLGDRRSPTASSRPSRATSSSPRRTSCAPTRGFRRGPAQRGIDDPADRPRRAVVERHLRARPARGMARAICLAAARRRRRQPVRAAAVRPRGAPSTSTTLEPCCGSTTTRPARRRRRSRAATTATAAAGPTADDLKPISRSRSRTARASRSTATACAGRTGTCASASTRARASCCTTSPTTTRASAARSATAPRSPSSSSPTATRTRRRTSRTCSTSASTGSAPLTNSLVARLRLPRRDRATSTRVTNTYTGEPLRDPERDLHPRGGRRPALEAHRRPFGRVDRARSRRLVISSIVTVGNYEYGFFWYLYQDGSWQFEAKLTGIVHSAGWVSDERSPYSLPLGEGFVTSNHQHFFCARLDLDVDGTANVAFDIGGVLRAVGRRRTPTASAFRPERPHVRRASRTAAAHISPRDGAAVPGREPRRGANRIGDPVSYELVPGENVGADAAARLVGAQARAVHRLQPLGHAVPRRRALPGGRVSRTSTPASDGLPRWTAADRDRSRARTSCSGTCSARTTSRASRTGP